MKLGSDVAAACHMFHTHGDKHACVFTDSSNDNSSFKKRKFQHFRSANTLVPVLFYSNVFFYVYFLSYSLLFIGSHCFGCMNIYGGVVISGQEIRSECFVDPCHMTGRRRRDALRDL